MVVSLKLGFWRLQYDADGIQSLMMFCGKSRVSCYTCVELLSLPLSEVNEIFKSAGEDDTLLMAIYRVLSFRNSVG